MENTVKIYQLFIENSYEMVVDKTPFSLYPYGKQTLYYKGQDDGGKDYILPDGYEVAIGNDEQPHIYNDKGQYCELHKYNDLPAIFDADRYYPLPLKINK
jgi:hypothetical protein